MELCYDLAAKPSFTALFSRVISTLTGREVGPEAYTEALDRIVVQLAETTKDPRIVEFMRHDIESVRIDPTYQPAPAFSVPTQPNVWIKESQLQRDARVIAGTLMHESAHVAGAPAHLPAEYLIEALHNAGYPRR